MTDKMKLAALEYAARGWPVFPVDQNKQPFPKTQGVLDATTNPDTISELWDRHPKANIALDVGGAGMMVLDLDPGHDWGELEDSVGSIPDTKLVATTPRGGEHLYFALEDDEIVAPSASKLAKNVDVRSFHSYVLLPPSRTDDGAYEWEGSPTAKPAFRTDEMVRVANVAKEKHEDRDEWKIEPDLPENVAAATRWLKKEARIATEGQGGDHEAYATGAHMKSFGISEEKAFELIWDYWNPRCRPPWDDSEEDHLRRKVENAYRYNTSPPGNITEAYQRAKAREMFQPVREKTPDGYKAKGKFRVVDRAAMEYLRPPEWIIEDTIHREGFAVLYGAPGTYKTFTALDMALCLCTGTDQIPARKKKAKLVGGKRIEKKQREKRSKNWKPNAVGRVLFCAGESPDYFEARISAWEKLYNGGEKVQNFVMVDPVPMAMDPSEWDIFLDEVFVPLAKEEFYDLIVIDTAAASLQGGDENNSKDMGNFIRMVQTIIRETGAAVLVIHHTNAQDKMRGSGTLRGAIDTQIFVTTEEDTQRLTMTPPMGKQRNAAVWSEDRALRATTVQLGEDKASVAMVRGELQNAKEEDGNTGSQKPKGKNASGFDAVKNEVALTLVDDILSDILQDNPLKEWSNKALAEALAMQERIAYSSAHLNRNVLVKLREDKEKRANKLYDPLTKRWRWKKGLKA